LKQFLDEASSPEAFHFGINVKNIIVEDKSVMEEIIRKLRR